MAEEGLRAGKLPPDLLARLLERAGCPDPRVVVGPRVGADAAVIDMGERLLVAKADPITFATDRIGWYAVQVNANDVACLGARPRWFMATLLLPEGSPQSLAEEVFAQIDGACRALGVSLVGGHTEVTYDLPRPILSGAMLGEAERGSIVLPGGARPGDALLLTKGIAIEGTAVLAREAPRALLGRGVPPEVVERARGFLFSPGISVVAEALAAAGTGLVHAMHDPTEGGLATGVAELASVSGVGAEVWAEAVPLLPECREVCHALGLDPLGLLASGSLLLAVPPEGVPRVVDAVRSVGVEVRQIGRLLPAAEGLRLKAAEGVGPLPSFPRDELARFFGQGGAS